MCLLRPLKIVRWLNHSVWYGVECLLCFFFIFSILFSSFVKCSFSPKMIWLSFTYVQEQLSCAHFFPSTSFVPTIMRWELKKKILSCWNIKAKYALFFCRLPIYNNWLNYERVMEISGWDWAEAKVECMKTKIEINGNEKNIQLLWFCRSPSAPKKIFFFFLIFLIKFEYFCSTIRGSLVHFVHLAVWSGCEFNSIMMKKKVHWI